MRIAGDIHHVAGLIAGRGFDARDERGIKRICVFIFQLHLEIQPVRVKNIDEHDPGHDKAEHVARRGVLILHKLLRRDRGKHVHRREAVEHERVPLCRGDIKAVDGKREKHAECGEQRAPRRAAAADEIRRQLKHDDTGAHKVQQL